MAKPIIPLGARVLVEAPVHETTTKSGFIVSENEQRRYYERSLVLAVGKLEELEVAIGDLIVYDRYQSSEVEHEDIKYLVVPESAIIARLSEKREGPV